MKVVLDTNVIVSGLITVDGVCGRIIDRMLEEDFQLCADGRIFAEYGRIVGRPKLNIPPGVQHDFLDFVRYRGERIAAAPIAAALLDESGVPFLEVALEANAVLVTGNLRHFPKRSRKGATVISPREFLDILARA